MNKKKLITSMLPAIYLYCYVKNKTIESFLDSFFRVEDTEILFNMYLSIFQLELEFDKSSSSFADSFMEFNINNKNYANLKKHKYGVSHSSVDWISFNRYRILWTATDESVSFLCVKEGFLEGLFSRKLVNHSSSERAETKVEVSNREISRENFTENAFNFLIEQLNRFIESDTNALLYIISKELEWGDLPKSHHWYEACQSACDKNFEIHFSSALEYLMNINAAKAASEIKWCLQGHNDSLIRIGKHVISRYSFPDEKKHTLVNNRSTS